MDACSKRLHILFQEQAILNKLLERRTSLAWRCSTKQVASDTERRTHAATESTKGGGKPDSRNGNAGSKRDQGRP